MRKQKHLFNNALRRYNKYRRKLRRLILTGKNTHRQGVLRKHIARLERVLEGLYYTIKRNTLAGGLATAALFAAPAVQAQTDITFEARTGTDNPFNGIDIGSRSAPTFGDIDGDGNLEMVVGEILGGFTSYEQNNGTWQLENPNPLQSFDVGLHSTPILVDWDNDGDFDMISGEYKNYDAARIDYFENDGSGGFTQITGSANDFNGIASTYGPFNILSPEVFDVDGDGDLDFIGGQYYSSIAYYQNDGTDLNLVTSGSPFAGIDVGDREAPIIADLDGDGDGDLLVGSSQGKFAFYLNESGTFNQQTGADNPFDGFDVGSSSIPALFDLDGDGDLDMISGATNGEIKYFVNTTPLPSTVPTFTLADPNPLAGLNGEIYSAPTFTDVDGDGDLDLLSGNYYGLFEYFQNDGMGNYTEQTGANSPFSTLSTGTYSSKPIFVDVDGDGDLDLVSGENDGTFEYFQNNGMGTYAVQNASNNPFSALNTEFSSAPFFLDLDSDGDIDLVSGDFYGVFKFFANNGMGVFTEQTGTDNPFNGIDVGFLSTPTFIDIDGDGNLDLVSGYNGGTFNYFQNDGMGNFTEQTGTDNPFNGLDVGDQSTPTFVDIDGDGDMDLVSGNQSGTFNVFYNVSTPATPNQAPTAVCEDFTAELDANGTVTITGADIDGGSTDPDGDTLTLTVTPDTFDCDDIGTDQTVTLTVDDGNGETDTCTATVTVQDNLAPTVVTQDITVALGADGSVTITPDQINNGSTDNCTDTAALTLSLDQTDFDCSDLTTGTTTSYQGLSVQSTNGNQNWGGTLGIEFDVVSAITVDQLGVFDHLGNGINSGPLTVGIFDRTTQAIVSGLSTSVSGSNEPLVGGHRMRSITPVVLPPGQYFVGATGFDNTDLNGNQGIFTNPYPNRNLNQGDGAVTYGTSRYSGPNALLTYPTASDTGTYQFIAASFNYTVTTGTPPPTVTLTVTDANGNSNTGTATVTVEDPNGFCCDATTTWDGTSWSNGAPNFSTAAIFAGNYDTTTSGDIEACSVTVNTGATLAIDEDNFVSIQNSLTNNGTLNIADGANLVQVNDAGVAINNGNIDVEIITPDVNPRDFILIGSPVTAEPRSNLAGFRMLEHNTANFTPNNDVETNLPDAVNFMDEEGDDWTAKTGNLAGGEGYYYIPGPNLQTGGSYTLNFTEGTLNTGTLTYDTGFGDDKNDSPNILSNPYPSALDGNAVILQNAAISELYFWEHNSEPSVIYPGWLNSNHNMDDISVYTQLGGNAAASGGTAPGRYLAPGQGFGIKANNATDVTFTNAMRAVETTTLRNQTSINTFRLRMENGDGELASNILLGFTPETTEGYDAGWDSERIATPISLYSHIDGVASGMGIQAREMFNEEITINLGMQTIIEEATQQFTISLTERTGSDIESANIYLIDHQTDIFVDLTQETYTFNAVTGQYNERFTVYFMEEEELSTQEFGVTNIRLFPNPASNKLYIALADAQVEQLEVVDVNGRIIYSAATKSELITLDVSQFESAVYFVRLISSGETIVKRFIKE